MDLNGLLLFVGILCLSSLISSHDGCGKRPLVLPPGVFRIVGGREAPEGAWPWQVSIQILSMHRCSGMILNNLWVLTASHCFYKYLWINLRHFHVVAGLHLLSTPGRHNQIRSITKVIIHEHYNDKTSDNDVTLLMLRFPFIFTDHIQPVCIPHNDTHESTLSFSHCFISGWGSRYYNGRIMDRLQQAEVKLIDTRTCNLTNWYDGLITENMMCAGLESGAADACQGDSGGPLQCYSESEERFYVVGVTSFGDKCGLRYRPGVYARTSRFADWLKSSQLAALASAAQRLNVRLASAVLSAALMLL